MRYWVLQDSGIDAPYALTVLDDGNLVRRYVPGRGLVHFPDDVDEMLFGEPGGREVDQDEWLDLLRSGKTGVTLPDEVLAKFQGQAPDLPVPDDETVGG